MLQILVVIVLGTMATLLTGEFNRQRAERDMDRDEERRKAKKLDELRKDMLQRLNQAYSDFKRAKRLLRAQACSPPYYGTLNQEAQVNLDQYDQQLQVLNDVQLDLEHMAKDAEANRMVFWHSQQIADAIKMMEECLSRAITEYEGKRGNYGPNNTPKISDLPMLRDIVGPGLQGKIIPEFTISYKNAVGYIQQDVLGNRGASPELSGRETARSS